MKKQLLELCISYNLHKITMESNRGEEIYIFEIVDYNEDENTFDIQYYKEGDIPTNETMIGLKPYENE